jgi:hypothetical protein
MSIEAMKQALEALEGLWDDGFGGVPESMHKDAITALRQAIEQAEKQEPVAFVSGYYGGQCVILPIYKDKLFSPGTALYTAPVHASDISAERVYETAKCEHDLWIAAACLKSTVESAIKAGDWKVDGACDPTRDLAYLADCLANPKREWVGLTDEEIEAIYDQENHADVVLLTQAKLKEKNT